jgi:hypothetical protein
VQHDKKTDSPDKREREKKKATVRENDLHFFFLDVEDGSDEVKAQFSL